MNDLWNKYVPKARVLNVLTKREYDSLKIDLVNLTLDKLEEEIHWGHFDVEQEKELLSTIGFVRGYFKD